MTDISRNWFDLSVNSNVLKQTYINGFIDVSNKIVGRENMWVNNEKDVGNTRHSEDGIAVGNQGSHSHTIENAGGGEAREI